MQLDLISNIRQTACVAAIHLQPALANLCGQLHAAKHLMRLFQQFVSAAAQGHPVAAGWTDVFELPILMQQLDGPPITCWPITREVVSLPPAMFSRPCGLTISCSREMALARFRPRA